MNAITKPREWMPATPDPIAEQIAAWEQLAHSLPQIALETTSSLHAGIYSRTVRIPAGVVITGTRIRVPTVVTVIGEMRLVVGDRIRQVAGVTVFEAESNRKAWMYALTDCYVTMAYATNVQTLEEAEEEFTDEPDRLLTRRMQ